MSSSVPVPEQVTDEIRVLHVDDEPDLGALVATFLEQANSRLHIETATTARDGLELLAANDFDCVVSDYDMPEMNGVEFLEAIRSARPTLPFVLYTGKGSEEVASEALTAGATDYVQKERGTDHYSVLANRIVTVVERQRVRTKMDEVKHLFTELANRANDVLWLFTQDWEDVLFITEAYEEIFGQSRAVLKEEPTAFLDVVHPDDRSRVEAAMKRLTDGTSVDFEFRIGDTTGGSRWVWIKGDPITDRTGQVTHVGGFTRDITDKKEREQEIERINTQLQAAIDAGGVRTWEWDIQADTVSVGPAFAQTFGIDPDDAACGLPIERFLSAIHPADRERVETQITAAVDVGGSYEAEYRVENAAGEYRWVIARGRVESDEDGTPRRFPGSLIDITDRKDREAELLSTQRKYEAMFEDPNILVGVLTPDGIVKDINQTAMEYIDTTLAVVRGMPFCETPWFGDDPELKREINGWIEAAAAGEYVPFEAEITAEDGHRIVSGMFRPVTDADGVVTEIIVSDRDITEQRKKERGLKTSESRYRALAEHFPNGIVTMFDHDLRYTLAAGRAFSMIPVSKEDIEGSRPSDVWGPDIGVNLEARFEDALAGTPTAVQITYEGREWIIHAVPITDEDGSVLAGMTIAQDITEQTRYQAELERILELMERAEQIADVGSWEIDVETTEVFWSENLFEILDRAGDEPPLEEALEIYHEADRPIVATAVETALAAGESFDVEARIVRPDGEVRWLRVQGVPTVKNGEVVTLRGAVQDITEQKSYQQTLERQNQRLEEFASVVSHDLRNPLQVAGGRLELAREEHTSEHLAHIETALQRAEAIIDDVLQLARNGRSVGDMKAVDLRATATAAWEITGGPHEQATLSISTESEFGRIEADSDRLQQLFENLFRNSVEHGSTGSRAPPGDAIEHGGDAVTVTVGMLPDGFYVEDDGPGIPSENRETVFTAGYSTSADGTGFGLAIVDQIAKAHGWAVTATTGTAGGARFEFTGVERS